VGRCPRGCWGSLQTYANYGESPELFPVLTEDVELRFARVQPGITFPESVANAVTNLVEEVAEARNLARF
jgi:hypothetical protein